MMCCYQGRKSMFKHGGDNIGVNIHPACGMYGAKRRALLGGHVPREKNLMVRFGVYLDEIGSDFVFKNFKNYYFLYRFFKNDYFLIMY